MSETTQLRALHDAADKIAVETAAINPKENGVWTAADTLRAACLMAIASLEAEQPKACAGFDCGVAGCPCDGGKYGISSDTFPCVKCKQPKRAHQQPKACACGDGAAPGVHRADGPCHQPPAEQPKPCAKYKCGGWLNSTGKRVTIAHGDVPCDSATARECDCANCFQPYSAHQQPAESASGTTCVKCGGVGIAWDAEGDPVCGAHLHREPPANRKPVTDSDWADKAQGVARALSYNGNEHEAAAKHLLNEMAHRINGRARSKPAPAKERIWSCKIGGIVGPLPMGADAPMRNAVEEVFEKLTGSSPSFIFSGWSGELTKGERAVVENRLPREQPAPADVPPMPDAEDDDWWGTASADDVRAIVFAREAAIAAERDEARRALHAACVRIAQERDEEQRMNAYHREGEAMWRNAEHAERARADKAEAELAALRKRLSYRQDEDGSQSDEIDRLEMALRLRDNEPAALKGQEPVAWRTPSRDTPGYWRFHQWIPWAGTPNVQPLYAAPVPPPDSVPREQHEAALAQARREERERCASVCESYASGCRDHIEVDAQAKRSAAHRCAAAIRALAEGGEVGK